VPVINRVILGGAHPGRRAEGSYLTQTVREVALRQMSAALVRAKFPAGLMAYIASALINRRRQIHESALDVNCHDAHQ
jgi:hypothetical protein